MARLELTALFSDLPLLIKLQSPEPGVGKYGPSSNHFGSEFRPEACKNVAGRLAICFFFGSVVLGGAGPNSALDVEDEVDDYEDIHQEENNFDPGDVANYFEDFPGEEGCGEDEGEIFGPGFFERETGPFDDIECRVEEDGGADFAEAMGIDEGDFFEDEIDEVVFGIEA